MELKDWIASTIKIFKGPIPENKEALDYVEIVKKNAEIYNELCIIDQEKSSLMGVKLVLHIYNLVNLIVEQNKEEYKIKILLLSDCSLELSMRIKSCMAELIQFCKNPVRGKEPIIAYNLIINWKATYEIVYNILHNHIRNYLKTKNIFIDAVEKIAVVNSQVDKELLAPNVCLQAESIEINKSEPVNIPLEKQSNQNINLSKNIPLTPVANHISSVKEEKPSPTPSFFPPASLAASVKIEEEKSSKKKSPGCWPGL